MLGILPEVFVAVTCLLFKLDANLPGTALAITVTCAQELWDVHQGAPAAEGLPVSLPKGGYGSDHHSSAAQIYVRGLIPRKANGTFVVLLFSLFCTKSENDNYVLFCGKIKFIPTRRANKGEYFFKFLAKYTYHFWSMFKNK